MNPRILHGSLAKLTVGWVGPGVAKRALVLVMKAIPPIRDLQLARPATGETCNWRDLQLARPATGVTKDEFNRCRFHRDGSATGRPDLRAARRGSVARRRGLGVGYARQPLSRF